MGDSLKAIATAKATGGHLEIFGTKMVVEAKLDRPMEGEQGRSPRQSPDMIGEMNFEQLYRCEKSKNERLQAVIREQRRTIQRLERNSRSNVVGIGESSMESSITSKRFTRNREASVCAVDSLETAASPLYAHLPYREDGVEREYNA